MNTTQTIRAQVNPRLLNKADRLFTGSLRGRIIEVLQNARRAGSTQVQITRDGKTITVQDNGTGIEDFRNLLNLGGSGWDDSKELEASEDPAGVGLFCLAPRKLTIESKGKRAVIEGDGWRGSPVTVVEGGEGPEVGEAPAGTTLRFEDEPWDFEVVEPLAVFTGMRVTVDERVCSSEPFISHADAHDTSLGCRLQVIQQDMLSQWQRNAARVGCMGETNVVVNFHGQTVGFTDRPIAERDLFYFIDLTGEPTGIRLMLPARTRLVENQALTQLKALIEREAYRYVERRGHHKLPYLEYQRAHQLGIELPESEPVFSVGLLTDDGFGIETAEVAMPEGFDLSRCYRFDSSGDDAAGSGEINAHLLAALGTFDQPLVPVSIRPGYDGYRWADLPLIECVEVDPGKELIRDWVWNGELICVDSLRIRAEASNGAVFDSAVPMAVQPPDLRADSDCRVARDQHTVYVTPRARHELSIDWLWYHLGGFDDDGDTWDTQKYELEKQIDAFWARLEGPDEPLRRKLFDATYHLPDDWATVTLHRDGRMTLTNRDGATRTIAPPQPEGDSP